MPSFDETGIDRLQVRVKGVCRASAQGASAREYRLLLATAHPDLDWLRTPATSFRETKVGTRTSISATIGFEVLARDTDGQHVALTINHACNPTRTLAHLLHRFRGVDDIAGRLAQIGPVDFFTSDDGLPLSLDHQTNWLSDIDLAHQAFGADIFSGFLPIYVEQLRALTVLIVSPDMLCEAVEDGGEDVLRSDAYEVRLDWRHASAPQCETYFERHHGSAQSVVRAAAQNVLTKLDHATVRHHLYEAGFERRGDLFSMRCKLPQNRDLSIYAKDRRRLRFEVKRNKSGRYPTTVHPGSSGRLLTILTSERDGLLGALQWRVVGDLLAEHGVPLVGDLTSLATLTATACATSGANFGEVLTSLISDGGISETENNTQLIANLADSGVIERVTLRLRDHPLPKRRALRGPYLAAFEAVLDALSTSDISGGKPPT